MKTALGCLGIKEKSPHPRRHTFSRLSESYGVREADRKRMLGHSFGNDITNGVYGHRTLEELRTEIEKIKVLENAVFQP
jgi:integrase